MNLGYFSFRVFVAPPKSRRQRSRPAWLTRSFGHIEKTPCPNIQFSVQLFHISHQNSHLSSCVQSYHSYIVYYIIINLNNGYMIYVWYVFNDPHWSPLYFLQNPSWMATGVSSGLPSITWVQKTKQNKTLITYIFACSWTYLTLFNLFISQLEKRLQPPNPKKTSVSNHVMSMICTLCSYSAGWPSTGPNWVLPISSWRLQWRRCEEHWFGHCHSHPEWFTSPHLSNSRRRRCNAWDPHDLSTLGVVRQPSGLAIRSSFTAAFNDNNWHLQVQLARAASTANGHEHGVKDLKTYWNNNNLHISIQQPIYRS